MGIQVLGAPGWFPSACGCKGDGKIPIHLSKHEMLLSGSDTLSFMDWQEDADMEPLEVALKCKGLTNDNLPALGSAIAKYLKGTLEETEIRRVMTDGRAIVHVTIDDLPMVEGKRKVKSSDFQSQLRKYGMPSNVKIEAVRHVPSGILKVALGKTTGLRVMLSQENLTRMIVRSLENLCGKSETGILVDRVTPNATDHGGVDVIMQ